MGETDQWHGMPDQVRAAAEQQLSSGRLPISMVADWLIDNQRDPVWLAQQLLHQAKQLSRPPISDFHVGCVVLASEQKPLNQEPDGSRASGMDWPNDESATLYLGANLELPGLELAAGFHAEQCAVNWAWQHRHHRVSDVIVNAAPCGLCRQFLREVPSWQSLRVHWPRTAPSLSEHEPSFNRRQLSELLPHSFGPDDLGIDNFALLSLRASAPATDSCLPQSFDHFHATDTQNTQNGNAAASDNNELDRLAQSACHRSYSPYSGVAAGLTLRLTDGRVVSGCSIENAAYHPSLSPLQSALAAAVSQGWEVRQQIQQAVLVETRGPISHRQTTARALQMLAPTVEFRYRQIAAS